MKKPYKIFLVAFGLIISGLIMDGLIDYAPLSTNPQLRDVSILGHSSYSFQVNSQGNIQINGLFTSVPSGPINMKVLNPDKSILWEDTSIKSSEKGHISLGFMNPNSSGSLEVVILNLGDEEVIVTGIMYDQKVLQDENDIEGTIDAFFDYLVYLLISALLKLAGIVLGIIGIILFFKKRKNMNEEKRKEWNQKRGIIWMLAGANILGGILVLSSVLYFGINFSTIGFFVVADDYTGILDLGGFLDAGLGFVIGYVFIRPMKNARKIIIGLTLVNVAFGFAYFFQGHEYGFFGLFILAATLYYLRKPKVIEYFESGEKLL